MADPSSVVEREWIPLGDFARRLGIARASVYGRIKRGTLEATRANRGGYLVAWPPPDHDGSGDVGLQRQHQPRGGSATAGDGDAALHPAIVRLEQLLAAAEQERGELRAQVVELRVATAVAEARIEAVRQAAEDRVAARNAAIEVLQEARDDLAARLDRAEARLALPWWRRLIG